MSKSKGTKHDDCKNFIPIDAAKGLCAWTNEMIAIDSECCPKYDALPKCKNCKSFTDATKDGLGTCVGLEDKSFWSYGEMPAVNCQGWNQ
jgi:4-hydroxyphenylacetate decarboxylase small subunit